MDAQPENITDLMADIDDLSEETDESDAGTEESYHRTVEELLVDIAACDEILAESGDVLTIAYEEFVPSLNDPEAERAELWARTRALMIKTEYFKQCRDKQIGDGLRAVRDQIYRAHGGAGVPAPLGALRDGAAKTAARAEWRQQLEMHDKTPDDAKTLINYSMLCEHLPSLLLARIDTEAAVRRSGEFHNLRLAAPDAWAVLALPPRNTPRTVSIRIGASPSRAASRAGTPVQGQ